MTGATAGFAVAGQEYNHDLLACETGLHDGRAGQLGQPVLGQPARALLSALKPRGNPLAAGGAGDAGPAAAA